MGGDAVHVAQFEVYTGIPYELRSAMSQLPDEPPLQSPKHPRGPKMTLKELRERLRDLELPTIGGREELEMRYDYAMRLRRAAHESWDAALQSWVPINAA